MQLIDRLVQNSSFAFNKPGVIPRVIQNYISKGIFKKNPLRTVDLVFEYRCNYKCSHCYASDFETTELPPLSVTEIFETVDKCCDEGAFHFNIIGGEPTLHKDLFKLIDYINRKPAIMSLATNGSMIDLEYARNLKKNGLDVVLLSLDSLYEEEHDQIRGKGSYKKAIKAMESCFKVNLKVYISTVLTKKNIRDGSMQKLESFCAQRKMLMHTNLPALYGMWKGREDLFFSAEDKELVRKLYSGKHVRACEMSSYFATQCRSGKEKLHITAYGDVMPCTFVPITFGNVKTEKLSDIRKKMLTYPHINEHNEMCIPSTNKAYNVAMTKKLNESSQVPIHYEEFLKIGSALSEGTEPQPEPCSKTHPA